MAHPEPTHPHSSDEGAPEWLMSAAEGAQRPQEPVPPRSARPSGGKPDADVSASDAGKSGPVAWKAAASSIPRLREAPVAVAAEEAFTGFAQDALEAKIGPRSEVPRRATADEPFPSAARAPVSPWWSTALGRARELPVAVQIAVPALLAAILVTFAILGRSERPSLSLSQLRQHPEAFAGRTVEVRGKAGEGFSIGDSYVFALRHSRDTIVVYSRSRRPTLHENVAVKGVVSIGYLDGVARVALLENPGE